MKFRKWVFLVCLTISLSISALEAGAGVSFYRDDGKCEPGKFLGSVGSRTDCKALPFTSRVWGVRLDGRCLDISDMEPEPACEMFKFASDGVLFYSDDGRCEWRNLLGSAGPMTDCSAQAFSGRVWGISVAGRCIDISDAEPERACELYQNRRHGVAFYRDDGKCEEGRFLGAVGPFTDCETLPFSDRVWGIEVNGQCQDISDLDPKQACLMYQNGLMTEAQKSL